MKLHEVISELKLWHYRKVDIHPRLEDKELFIDCSWKQGMMIEYDKKTKSISCPGAMHVEVDLNLLDSDDVTSLAGVIEMAVIKSRAASVNLP